MDVDQVISGIGSAVASAQSQNICVYWCMTKSEWASWVQAVGSIVGLAVAIGIAAWSRCAEKRKIADENRKIAEDRLRIERDTRLNVERFISLASASIESIDEIFNKGAVSKRDLLLRGTAATEALEISKIIDLNRLDLISASTVLAARSICNQLELLLQEERGSNGTINYPMMRQFITHFLERIQEIEKAWVEKRMVKGAPIYSET